MPGYGKKQKPAGKVKSSKKKSAPRPKMKKKKY